jgi:hypothetical protein
MSPAHSFCPSTAAIAVAQNRDENLRRIVASRDFYRRGRWLHLGGAVLPGVLALASPFVLIYKPSLGAALAAIAGAWIFASRVVLEPFAGRFQLKGATAQELFDCSIFGLPWNRALARPISEEEIRRASGKMKQVQRLRDWYPTSYQLDWPGSVLICQRSNAVWARRQHSTYGNILVAVAVAWVAIGIGVALVHSASLRDYLVIIALPSLPAVLDATEEARRHFDAAAKRMIVEERTDTLLGPTVATAQDLREIQDQLFAFRRDEPFVPQWFYRLVRSNYEDMRYAEERIAQQQPASTDFSNGTDG